MTAEKTNEENMQKLYVEYQVLTNTIKQLEKQDNALENQLIQLMTTAQSLDEIKNVKKGTGILFPLSSGIYLKAELQENDSFIVNVGSNVMLKKNVELTQKLVESQIDDIRRFRTEISEELEKSTGNASKLQKEIEKIASALQN